MMLAFHFLLLLTACSQVEMEESEKNGFLIMGGRWSGETMEWFNPWNSIQNRLLASRLSPSRRAHFSAVLNDGRVLVAGGWDIKSQQPLSSMALFDPIQETWTPGPSMSTKRAYPAAAAIDGIVFVCGGGDGRHTLSSCEQFKSGVWQSMASMSRARQSFAMVALNGTLYAIGGFNGSYQSLVEAYDIHSDSWTLKTPMPTPRYAFGLAVMGSSIVACGGWNAGERNVCEKYDLAADSWTEMSEMKMERNGLTLEVVGDRLLALGGDQYSNTVEMYDPITNKWSLHPGKLMKDRSFHTAVLF